MRKIEEIELNVIKLPQQQSLAAERQWQGKGVMSRFVACLT